MTSMFSFIRWLFVASHLALFLLPSSGWAVEYFVSPLGNDANTGRTQFVPWRTISRAVRSAGNTVTAGDVITLMAGTYGAPVIVEKSGTAAAPITLRGAPGSVVTISGANVQFPLGGSVGLLRMGNVHHWVIQDLSFSNLSTSLPDGTLPIGIWIERGCQDVTLRNLKISDIHHTADLAGSPSAHGILLSGNSEMPLSGIVIEGCELFNMNLGQSEALAVNGNVDGFTIRNCSLHDIDNIGIDIIGYEGWAPRPEIDRARNGLISGNTIYNVDTINNVAYVDQVTGIPARAAAGIYVDGGTQCIIERNHIYNCNFGVELASEATAPATCDFITLTSNLIHHNHSAGILLGGFEPELGITRDCEISHNTLYRNGVLSSFDGQITFQYNVTSNRFHNNVIYTNGSGAAITNEPAPMGAGNTFNYNAYFAPSGNLYFTATNAAGATGTYRSLSAWRSRIGSDAQSVLQNPGFKLALPTPSSPPTDYGLAPDSLLRDAGDPLSLPAAARLDFFGNSRLGNGRVDIGMHEIGVAAVVQSPQTITNETVLSHVYRGLPLVIDLLATASSGLPVAAEVVSGPGELLGSNLKVTGAGTVEVRFSQAGNAAWSSAENTVSLNIASGVLPSHMGPWLQEMGQADGRYWQGLLAKTSDASTPDRSTNLIFTQIWAKPTADDLLTDAIPMGLTAVPVEQVVRVYTSTRYSVDAVLFNGLNAPFLNAQVATNYAGSLFKALPGCHALRYRIGGNGVSVMMLFGNGEIWFRGMPATGVRQMPWGHRVNLGSNATGTTESPQLVSLNPLQEIVTLQFPGSTATIRIEPKVGSAKLYASLTQMAANEATQPLAVVSGNILAPALQPNFEHTSPWLPSVTLLSFLTGTVPSYGSISAEAPVPLWASRPQFTLQRPILNQTWQFQTHVLQTPVPVEDASRLITASPWGDPHPHGQIPTGPLKMLGNVARFKVCPTALNHTCQLQVGGAVFNIKGQNDLLSVVLKTSLVPYLVKIRQIIPGPTAAIYGPWVEIGSILSIGVGETTLLTPAEASTTPAGPVTFSWSPVAGATKYKMGYRRKGTTTYSTYIGPLTSFTTTTALKAATDWQWYVIPLTNTQVGLLTQGTFRSSP